MLTKANLTPVKDASELEALIEKTKAKIEKAKTSSCKDEQKGKRPKPTAFKSRRYRYSNVLVFMRVSK